MTNQGRMRRENEANFRGAVERKRGWQVARGQFLQGFVNGRRRILDAVTTTKWPGNLDSIKAQTCWRRTRRIAAGRFFMRSRITPWLFQRSRKMSSPKSLSPVNTM